MHPNKLYRDRIHFALYTIHLNRGVCDTLVPDLGFISPSSQLDKSASAIKAIEEKETTRVARLHATQHLHCLKGLQCA